MRFLQKGLFVTGLLLPAVAHGQMLNLRNHRAFSLPFYRLSPITRPMGTSKQWTLGFSESNDESQLTSPGHLMEEDGEFSRIQVQFRAKSGCGEWLYSGTAMAFHGGVLDKVIELLHRTLLGSTDPLRDESPDGRSFVEFDGDRWNSGAGIGNLSAAYVWEIGKVYFVQAGAKVPFGIGTALADSRSLDFGIGIGKSFSFAKSWSADVHLAAVRQGNSKEFRNVRRWVDSEAVAFIWDKNSQDDWILQIMSEASALRSGIAFADSAHRSVALGYRRKLSNSRSWEVFFAEDYDPLTSLDLNRKQVGPDIVIGVQFTIGKK